MKRLADWSTDRETEASFREEGGGGVYGPPRISDFNFFSVIRTFETMLLLQKQYVK